MAFHDVIFPMTLKEGSKGGRTWMVDVFESTLSGVEQRNLYHANGRRYFTPVKGNVNQEEKNELVAFWNARQGKMHSFYYLDSEGTDESGSGSLAGELVPVRFNMDRFEPEAKAPGVWNVSTLELIEVIGET